MVSRELVQDMQRWPLVVAGSRQDSNRRRVRKKIAGRAAPAAESRDQMGKRPTRGCPGETPAICLAPGQGLCAEDEEPGARLLPSLRVRRGAGFPAVEVSGAAVSGH